MRLEDGSTVRETIEQLAIHAKVAPTVVPVDTSKSGVVAHKITSKRDREQKCDDGCVLVSDHDDPLLVDECLNACVISG